MGHWLTPFLHPCQAAQRKLRQASTNVKHWNVQMNRLMHPIGPGGRRPAEHPSLDLLSTAMLGLSPDPHPSSLFGGIWWLEGHSCNASCKKGLHKPFYQLNSQFGPQVNYSFFLSAPRQANKLEWRSLRWLPAPSVTERFFPQTQAEDGG